MTPLTDRDRVDVVLDRLRQLLSPQRIQQEVDEPIDHAISTYQENDAPSQSVQDFHRRMGAFVRHVFAKGLPAAAQLTDEQAIGEAIELLEDSDPMGGYDNALLDTLDANRGGVSSILSLLGELLKLRQRNRYFRSVFVTELGSCDWNLRCRIVQHLQHSLASSLTPELRNCPHFQLVDELPSLLLTHLGTDQTLDRFLSAPAELIGN